eukprot:59337-Amphidinium_carterae.2
MLLTGVLCVWVVWGACPRAWPQTQQKSKTRYPHEELLLIKNSQDSLGGNGECTDCLKMRFHQHSLGADVNHCGVMLTTVTDRYTTAMAHFR